MKVSLLTLCVLLASTLYAQGNLPMFGVGEKSQTEESDDSQQTELPDWVKELSNLPEEERAVYTDAFARAKNAFTQGHLAECESYLNTCEFYTQLNPNVWNLRASVRISQKRFDEALPLLEKVRQLNPEDSVSRLSFSLLYLGKGDYEKCLEETEYLIEDIRYKNMEQLTHSLMFRKLLCYMMMEREEEARAVVEGIGPIDDSPLYYYSQGVFSLAAGKRREAMRDFNTADLIYASVGYLSGYKQALAFSGLTEKMTTAEKSEQ